MAKILNYPQQMKLEGAETFIAETSKGTRSVPVTAFFDFFNSFFAKGQCRGLRLFNSLSDLNLMREELTSVDDFFIAFTTVDKIENSDWYYKGVYIINSENVINLNETKLIEAIYNVISAKQYIAQIVSLSSSEELGTLFNNSDSFPFIAKINFNITETEVLGLNENTDVEQGDFVIFYDVNTADIIKKSTLTQLEKPLDLSKYPSRRKAMPRDVLMTHKTGMYKVIEEGYVGYSATAGTIYCPKGAMIYIDSESYTISIIGDTVFFIEDVDDVANWKQAFTYTWHDFNESIADYPTRTDVEKLISSSITEVLEGTG